MMGVGRGFGLETLYSCCIEGVKSMFPWVGFYYRSICKSVLNVLS